jgi:hypothetical protein
MDTAINYIIDHLITQLSTHAKTDAVLYLQLIN